MLLSLRSWFHLPCPWPIDWCSRIPPKEHEKNPSCSLKSLPMPLARNSHNRCDERSSNAQRPESFFYNSQRSSSITILPSRNSGYKEFTSAEVRYVIATKLASTPGLRRSRSSVKCSGS
jgi:hypothetical protein